MPKAEGLKRNLKTLRNDNANGGHDPSPASRELPLQGSLIGKVIGMKTLKQSFTAKLIAVLLLCAMALCCIASAGGALYLYDSGAYTMGYDAAARDAVDGIGENLALQAADRYRNDIYEDGSKPVNFRCVIQDAAGGELFSDYEGEETLWDRIVLSEPAYHTWTQERRVYADGTTESADVPEESGFIGEEPEEADSPEITPTRPPYAMAASTPVPTGEPSDAGRIETVWLAEDWRTGETREFESREALQQWKQENTLRVHGYILRDLKEGDEIWSRLYAFRSLYRYRGILPWLAAGSLLLGILLFLFLIAAAGWHKGEEKPRESFVDRIPFDLFTLLIITAETPVFAGIFGPGWVFGAVSVAAFALLLVLGGLIFLLWCMSLAVRVKCGTVWKNNVLTRCWGWFVRACKKLWGMAVRGLKALPSLWRWVVILGAMLLLELLCISSDGGRSFLFLLHVFVLFPALLYGIWQLRKLRLAAHKIAQGDLNTTVDTKGMVLELKEHAEDLNAIRDGVNAAVEERMKSERFRTELITNVSHDIKTPLTSIVSYVDLLEKEELENETAKGYVEVLSRQALRLKKLIEDLMDASKASTGALTVNWETLELGVLLDQAAGEYRERMEKAGLELLVTKPERPVNVRGDGRHMWRIFDNLLGNIVKYAQPGTRVYLDLAEKNNQAEITFRNISRSRLNVSGEELSERFVRGDASRSSEGSGLGLSIAMSLAQLQKGELRIAVDGDLFKATLLFDETA